MLVGYQPHNPVGPNGSVPFVDEADASAWAQANIIERETSDAVQAL